MKKFRFTLLAAFLALGLVAGHTARADDYLPEPYDMAGQPGELFTAEELDDLLAPIALYPDPLLAQVLPAATFIDQIDEAARYVAQYGQAARVDDQNWDVSVRAVAHYPDILFMMDQKYDWTVSVGQAYVNQPQDVLDAIQRLRTEARGEGNLVSTPQQEVIVEDGYIRIVPAAPQVIYVPTYDPIVVYAQPAPSYGFITFGIGFTIGAWLNRDCDWHRHRIYYHGWSGPGWVGRARPYVDTRHSVYISNNYSVVHVNKRVVQHDTVRYHEEIRRNTEYRREHRPVQATPAAPGRETRPRSEADRHETPQHPASSPPPRPAPAPVTSAPRPTPQRVTTGTPSAPRPGSTELYRGREPRGDQPAARTGYGGYGSGKDANAYRERGQSSRQNTQQFNHPQPAAVPAHQGPATTRQPAPTPATPRQGQPATHGGGGQQQQQR